MREAAAKICRDFLHGAWKTVSPQDLIFKRIRYAFKVLRYLHFIVVCIFSFLICSGGLSNFLYYVALPEKATETQSSVSPAPPLSVDDNSPDASDDDKEKKSTIRKLLGRSFSRQASFLTEEPQKVYNLNSVLFMYQFFCICFNDPVYILYRFLYVYMAKLKAKEVLIIL